MALEEHLQPSPSISLANRHVVVSLSTYHRSIVEHLFYFFGSNEVTEQQLLFVRLVPVEVNVHRLRVVTIQSSPIGRGYDYTRLSTD